MRRAQMVPLVDVIAIVNWERLRQLPYFERRAKIAGKIKNGRNCARKTKRAQKRARIVLAGEVGKQFSEEAQDTKKFARRFLKKKGESFSFRTRKYGTARISEVFINVAA